MPAFLAAPLFKYGLIALVIVGLGLAAVWYRHEAGIAREAQALAETARDLARQDAARWQAATDVRDQRLANLGTVIEEQNAAVQASRAKERELRASLDSARLMNDRLAAEADKLSKELDDEATQAPADVRELGPIVLRRAPRLFDN